VRLSRHLSLQSVVASLFSACEIEFAPFTINEGEMYERRERERNSPFQFVARARDRSVPNMIRGTLAHIRFVETSASECSSPFRNTLFDGDDGDDNGDEKEGFVKMESRFIGGSYPP